MTGQNELLKLIEKQIEVINKYVDTVSFESMNDVDKNRKLIEDNIESNDFIFLKEFDINELKRILPDSYNQDINNLLFYKSILSSSYRDLLNKQIDVVEQIKDILSRIHTYLVGIISKQEEDKKKVISFGKVKMNLEILKDKISSNNQEFSDEDIETVYTMLDSLDDRDKAIELMISFGEELLSNKQVIDNKKDDNDDDMINEDPLVIYDELGKIFSDYGLDFEVFYNKLSDREKKEFLNYVKVNNVKDILEVLKEFDISLNDIYSECSLLLYKSSQLKTLFIYSNKDTLRNVLEVARDEKILYDGISLGNGSKKIGIDFDLLLEQPFRFIDRKYKWKENKKRDGVGKNSNDVFGASRDFIENLILFKSYGINPIDFCNNSKVSIIPNKKIRKIIDIFNLYGIEKERFIKTLSCFDSVYLSCVLDMFIELGRFDYIKKNLSRCRLDVDNIIFYRLIYALKYTNIPMEELIDKNGRFTSLIVNGISKSDKDKVIPMTDLNKRNMVNQIKDNNESFDEYDKLYSSYESDISLAKDSDFIRLLDNNYLNRSILGEVIQPGVYCFGSIDTLRGKWYINISRNKVLRICNNLIKNDIKIDNMDVIMYMITKNSILTQEEYNIIYNEVDKVRKRSAIK